MGLSSLSLTHRSRGNSLNQYQPRLQDRLSQDQQKILLCAGMSDYTFPKRSWRTVRSRSVYRKEDQCRGSPNLWRTCSKTARCRRSQTQTTILRWIYQRDRVACKPSHFCDRLARKSLMLSLPEYYFSQFTCFNRSFQAWLCQKYRRSQLCHPLAWRELCQFYLFRWFLQAPRHLILNLCRSGHSERSIQNLLEVDLYYRPKFIKMRLSFHMMLLTAYGRGWLTVNLTQKFL